MLLGFRLFFKFIICNYCVHEYVKPICLTENDLEILKLGRQLFDDLPLNLVGNWELKSSILLSKQKFCEFNPPLTASTLRSGLWHIVMVCDCQIQHAIEQDVWTAKLFKDGLRNFDIMVRMMKSVWKE